MHLNTIAAADMKIFLLKSHKYGRADYVFPRLSNLELLNGSNVKASLALLLPQCNDKLPE